MQQQLVLAAGPKLRSLYGLFSLSSCKQNQFVLSSQTTSSSQNKVSRSSIAATYKPSIFLSHSLLLDNTNYSVEKQKEGLEKEVRNALSSHGNDEVLTVLELIDDIQKLGLSNRFEEEIYNTLRFLSQKEEECINGGCSCSADTLHGVSLNFRLRRQHGFDTSQDTFKRFMNHQGKFVDSIREDIKGMVSLYEAAHLATEEEYLLQEAKAFTTKQLQSYIQSSDSSNENFGREQVIHALELPLHWRIPLQDSHWYIRAYSRRLNADRKLLELAVLEFNLVQSIYKEDFQFFSRWWENMGLTKTLHFARDRPMQCFFWALGMAPHPQWSNCRRQLSKVASFITVIDDIYDIYGLPEELEMFTAAVQRWDINSVNDLPNYMKICFLALYNTVNEIAYDTLKNHEINIVPYLANAWGDLFKSFLEEGIWSKKKMTPDFGKYLKNGRISSSGHVLQAHSYFLTTTTITKEALESLQSFDDDVLPWPSTILRLCNDLATSSVELERGETANSVSCYMHETKVSEEEARKHINEVIDMSWRKMNKFQTTGSSFLRIGFNLARTAHFMYHNGDAHGNPHVVTNQDIHSLIFDPIHHQTYLQH